MPSVREYQFVVGAETDTLPTAGTPTDPSDTVTLGYAEDHFVQGGAPVSDLTALIAVAPADRADGDVLLVKSSNTLYRFDSASSATADGTRIVQPASGSGRWFRIRPGETASNGNYSVAGDITVGGSAIISGNVEVTGNATINGTLTAINSTTLEVVDANILINNGGNTASADLADAGFTVEISDGTNAKVGYNSTLASKFMAGNVGSESEIITASTDQTMTGVKTFDAPQTLKEQSSTPSTPASGYQKLYPKTDGKFYRLNSVGAEQELGAGGSGGGGVNYIANPNAETDTNGWLIYKDADQSTPVDGTGGSATTTWTRSTSSPLRGLASFLLTKGSGSLRGEGVGYAFTIDSADVSNTLQISMDVDGTDAAYVAGDLRVYIYDVTNSVLITPSQVNIAQASYKFTATFLATTSTSYRLIFHVASTNASAYAVKFDSIVVGPQVLALGSSSSGWEIAQEPVSGWFVSGPTNVTTTVYQKRDDDNINLRYRIVANGTSASFSAIQVRLPRGLSINSQIIANSTAAVFVHGGNLFKSGGGNFEIESQIDSGNLVFVRRASENSTSLITNSDPVGWNTTSSPTTLDIVVSNIPVSEWAGSGVYLGTAQPEYLFNSSTNDANDLVSFGYGPNGARFINLSSSGRTKRVRSLTPIQETDRIVFQIYNNGEWFDIGETNNVMNYQRQGSQEYGVNIVPVSGSNTDIDVVFAGYRLTSNATYGGAGADWSAIAATDNYRWRVVKIPGQVQVAVPTYPTATSMSDTIATALGYKVYRHGTTYNGGLSPTITTSVGGSLSSVTFSSFIPYETQGGVWRMRFTFQIAVASGSRSSQRMNVAGVTTASSSDQTFSGSAYAAAATINASNTINNTGNFEISHSTATVSIYGYSGDIELASKPTWAY